MVTVSVETQVKMYQGKLKLDAGQKLRWPCFRGLVVSLFNGQLMIPWKHCSDLSQNNVCGHTLPHILCVD